MVSNTSEPVANRGEILAELDRILGSRFLRDSQQLTGLLRHVVEETLEGRQNGLKEYALGRRVFHRPEDYDPRDDAIVRVQASLLRKRLAAYYQEHGGAAPVVIELPRGGYVPRFRVAHATVGASPVDTAPVPAAATKSAAEGADAIGAPDSMSRDFAASRRPSRWPTFLAGIAVGFAAAAMVAALAAFWAGSADRPGVESQSVWGAFLHPNTETTVSFGIPLFYVGPEGLYVRDTRVNRPGEEARGSIRWLSDRLQAPLRPQEDVYTGVGDVLGTHLISRWLDQRGVRTRLANSHHLGHSDVVGRNLVVVASARFQTLLQEMDLPRRIHFDPETGGGRFVLDNPLAGEQSFYQPTAGTGVETSYAVMSLWPGRNRQQRILYLSGVTTWATQGAAEFAIHPERLRELERRLGEDPAVGPRGPKGPYFQVLLRLEGKHNLVRAAHYVTHRYLPAPAP